MRIGLALPHYDFSFPDGAPSGIERVTDYARRAEKAGFDAVWVSDHLFLDLAKYGGPARRFGTPEALTMLGALAQGTERVGIGSLVLCAPFRPAALTAVVAADLHQVSGGRLSLGVGAGWAEAEFRSAGIPFGTAGQRIEHLRRAAGLIRVTMETGEAPHDGAEEPPRWRALAGDRPSIWLGGKGGPKIMRAVAEQADGWNVSWGMPPETYAERLGVLRDACQAVGRDPETVRRSVGLLCMLAGGEADIAATFETLRRWAPGEQLARATPESFAGSALVGTPASCAARIRRYEELGVEQVVLSLSSLPFALFDDEQLDLAADLIAQVR